MSKINSYTKNSGLAVAGIEVTDVNSIIFSQKVVPSISGLTKDDGKFFKLDVQANKAIQITPATISAAATTAANDGKDVDGMLNIAESYGLIAGVTFERDVDADINGGADALGLAKALNMDITDVTVEVQNAIIFKTTGIKNIAGLTKDADKYYQIDTKKNTATLINADGVADKAKADFLAGKSTDFTILADRFSLVSSLTLEPKAD